MKQVILLSSIWEPLVLSADHCSTTGKQAEFEAVLNEYLPAPTIVQPLLAAEIQNSPFRPPPVPTPPTAPALAADPGPHHVQQSAGDAFATIIETPSTTLQQPTLGVKLTSIRTIPPDDITRALRSLFDFAGAIPQRASDQGWWYATVDRATWEARAHGRDRVSVELQTGRRFDIVRNHKSETIPSSSSRIRPRSPSPQSALPTSSTNHRTLEVLTLAPPSAAPSINAPVVQPRSWSPLKKRQRSPPRRDSRRSPTPPPNRHRQPSGHRSNPKRSYGTGHGSIRALPGERRGPL